METKSTSILLEKYGLHNDLITNILNIGCTDLNKDYREEYIQYNKNIHGIKESVIVIINQFNKYYLIKKEFNVKKFEDIKTQIKYYIILINTFIILYALIIKNEYSYEIGSIPQHILKKDFNKKNCFKCEKKKKTTFFRRKSTYESPKLQRTTSFEEQIKTPENMKESSSTSTTTLNKHVHEFSIDFENEKEMNKKLNNINNSQNVQQVSNEYQDNDTIEVQEIDLDINNQQRIDNESNKNEESETQLPSPDLERIEQSNTIPGSPYCTTNSCENSSESDSDILQWKENEIEIFKKRFGKKNYFNNDEIFSKKHDLDDFFLTEDTDNIIDSFEEKRIYLSECYTDILDQKKYIWQLMDIDNDPIFKEVQIETTKTNIDERFKLNEIKLVRKIKLADKKYKFIKRKYDILNISIIVLSTSLTILESIKLEFEEHFPTNGAMDIILRATPISIGGLITFIGAFLKFSKYQEQMEEINIVSQKSITATSKIKTLREKLYFAKDKEIEEIIKEYQTNIYDEFNLCNQELKKYVKSSDYDKYLRDIYKTDYKIFCLEHDKQSLFHAYKSNVSYSLDNPTYTNWRTKIKDFFN